MTGPLRVAVVGSGPAGFYTVQHLFQAKELDVAVDMFDRLHAPFGLVRYGVAPDHQKIKSVTAVYHKLAQDPRFRFYGNVEYGTDLSLERLRQHYHQIVFCTGAPTDRQLGIPGEELRGSHPATDFVAWYNGHPDYCKLEFDLDCEEAVVVGVGNVAVDVARILCRTPEELATTDIADYALERLRDSRIRRVHLLGRRGPAQAAFTNPEVKELGELQDAAASTLAEEMQLDPVSRAALDSGKDKATTRKLDILHGFIDRREPEKTKRLVIRFLVSPTEILGDETGRVRAVQIVRNELYADGEKLRSRPTDRTERLDAGLVFRSVGYRGIPLAGLPFHDRWGVVTNEGGRVVDPDGGTAIRGLYVSGWIKRGPSGVIGTNKPDAGETVRAMLEDLARDERLTPEQPAVGAIETALRAAGVRFISYDQWMTIDAREVAKGAAQGRPRVKFTDRESLAGALS